MNVVHNVKSGTTVRGTVKASWMRVTFNTEQIDFSEFVKIHTAFPRLFEPAFRLQQLMMIHTMGEVWWTLKKRSLQDFKEEEERKAKKLVARKEKRKQQKKNRKIQRNMGLVKYYLCPCFRSYYDPSLTAYDKMTEEEKAEWDRQVAVARRSAELKLKNPETTAWQKYEKKLSKVVEDPLQVLDITEESKIDIEATQSQQLAPLVSNRDEKEVSFEQKSVKTYLEAKHSTTQRPREERAQTREERRNQRRREVQSL
jgi:hypothetical protein